MSPRPPATQPGAGPQSIMRTLSRDGGSEPQQAGSDGGAMMRTLSRVFSNSNLQEHDMVEELDGGMPTAQDICTTDEVVFCGDLMLSPLPSMETETSLHRAGVTAQKWALHRSMSTELPGERTNDSPAWGSLRPPPAQSPLNVFPFPGDVDGRDNDKLSIDMTPPLLAATSCVQHFAATSKLIYSMDSQESSFTEAELPPLSPHIVAPPPVRAITLPPSNRSGTDGDTEGDDSGTDEGEGVTIWERVFNGAKDAAKGLKPVAGKVATIVSRRSQGSAPPPVRRAGVGKKHKKRRVVVKDPNKPKPKPWSEAELAHFRHLLETEGPNDWAAKAATLGTFRSAKSLHTRWLRDEGRIVDKPRGMAAMREQATQGEAQQAAAAR